MTTRADYRRIVTTVWTGRPVVDHSWEDHAACRDQYDAFGTGNHHAAKRICAKCPVREACEEVGIAIRPKAGLWGGHGTGTLRKLRRERDRALEGER